MTIPVALFAYARSEHLLNTLAGLRANKSPVIYAFSDGPHTPDREPDVAAVRKILREVDWCEIILYERDENWGLGRSILAGVSEVLSKHEAVIVVEDDLVCVPGTYQYLSAALNYYQDFPIVMSITGWTHPLVTPHNVLDQPYFDGRAECWVWGTWARAWQGMDRDAKTLMQACKARGIDIYGYGADLLMMAEVELQKNIWAVRFLYHHILHGGLCLRPPYSLVEHIGFDMLATHSNDDNIWGSPPPKACPPLPDVWPAPVEHPECAALWQKVYGSKPSRSSLSPWLKRAIRGLQKVVSQTGSQVRGLN
jgi:hypothetical protein